MAKRESARRERGTGRIYQPRDPQHPDRTLQVWWIDYSVEGRRYRESSKSRKRSDEPGTPSGRTGLGPPPRRASAARARAAAHVRGGHPRSRWSEFPGSAGKRVRARNRAGLVRGRITRVIMTRITFKGYTVHASKNDPQDEIKSDKTDHIAMHKGSALRKLAD